MQLNWPYWCTQDLYRDPFSQVLNRFHILQLLHQRGNPLWGRIKVIHNRIIHSIGWQQIPSQFHDSQFHDAISRFAYSIKINYHNIDSLALIIYYIICIYIIDGHSFAFIFATVCIQVVRLWLAEGQDIEQWIHLINNLYSEINEQMKESLNQSKSLDLWS